MRRKKQQEVDEDGLTSLRGDSADAQPMEAFINHDLINDFVDTYYPGNAYNFTHIFSRPQLRTMFNATIDMLTVDPLPVYIRELSNQGYKEHIFNHEPCIFVIERKMEEAVEYEEYEEL